MPRIAVIPSMASDIPSGHSGYLSFFSVLPDCVRFALQLASGIDTPLRLPFGDFPSFWRENKAEPATHVCVRPFRTCREESERAALGLSAALLSVRGMFMRADDDTSKHRLHHQ